MDNETATELKTESITAQKYRGRSRSQGRRVSQGPPRTEPLGDAERETCGEGWAHAAGGWEAPWSAVCSWSPGRLMVRLWSKSEGLAPRGVHAGGRGSRMSWLRQAANPPVACRPPADWAPPPPPPAPGESDLHSVRPALPETPSQTRPETPPHRLPGRPLVPGEVTGETNRPGSRPAEVTNFPEMPK